MKCIACHRRSIPSNARLGTKYCSTACRALAYRKRHQAERRAADSEPLDVTDSEDLKAAAGVTKKRSGRVLKETTSPVANDARDSGPDAVMRPRRVSFDVQLRNQQPEGAAGYRLVLPVRSPADTPKIAPVPDSQGGVRYWRLDPFEIPDDIRLQEGLSYRVLWVDGTGQPLAPTTPYVPSLYFFLGPSDSEQTERDAAYAAILRDVRDPETRKKVEEEMARSRLYLQRQREREDLQDRAAARADRESQIESRETEERRRWEREDQAEREREMEREQEKQAKDKAAREAKDEREMWTAFKVMGGLGVVAAVGWGPFVRFLDSLQQQPPEVKASMEPLLKRVGTLLETLPSELAKLKAAISDPASAATTPEAPATMNGGSDRAAAQTTAKSEMPSRTPETIAQQTGDTGHVGSTRESVTTEQQQPTQQMGSGLMEEIQEVNPAQSDTNAATGQIDSRSVDADEKTVPQIRAKAMTEKHARSSGSAADGKTSSAMSDGPTDKRENPLARLSAEHVEKLCVIVLDVDLMAQALYKLNCVRARMAGTPEPSDPGLGLRHEECKLIHETIATPDHVAAFLYLWKTFQQAKDGGAEAMFALPPPLPSLTARDRDFMRHVLATPEERRYLRYLHQRRAARLNGNNPPPAEPLRLSQPMQKGIQRLDRDERAQVYLSSGVL